MKQNNYKIIAVDDEGGIIDSLSVFLRRSGYTLVGCTNPLEAIERVKNEHFDLMLLDFIMTPIHGDKVVEEIMCRIVCVSPILEIISPVFLLVKKLNGKCRICLK